MLMWTRLSPKNCETSTIPSTIAESSHALLDFRVGDMLTLRSSQRASELNGVFREVLHTTVIRSLLSVEGFAGTKASKHHNLKRPLPL